MNSSPKRTKENNPVYQLNQWVRHATGLLEGAGVPTARLDSLILLEDYLQKDRTWILANPDHELTTKQVDMLERLLGRRAAHEPLAYIRGKSEFYGREFIVTPATLQPRPETETMIELLKKIAATQSSIADIGTGSGCIAITAKLEFPEVHVSATEINTDALSVARKNAKKLGADIRFHQGNLYTPLEKTVPDILLCNLPYVPDSHTINEAAMQEPKIAIFGGKDGLDLYREMFSQIDKADKKPGFVLTESLPFQHKELANIAAASGYIQKSEEDFIQLFKA